MDLSLRPNLNASDKLTDDYRMIHDGRSVGRIRLASEGARQGVTWKWHINLPLPIPPWCNGTADSLEAAKDEFRAAWQRFYASLTPERIRRWTSLRTWARRMSGGWNERVPTL
jgi:hypothetical protein